jgi:hypothetical protein
MSEKDLDNPDVLIITQDNDSLDLGYGAVPPDYTSMSYGADTNTITLDSSTMYSTNTITLPSSSYTIGAAGSTLYSTGTGSYTWNNVTTTSPSVNITGDGIDMADGTDITVGGKSLKDFMTAMEERLAILRPNPTLEDRWEQLKELRRQYVEMEKDLLEKEKLMKILKET